MRGFRWNWWNTEHIAEHGIAPGEAESVVRCVARPFPEYLGEGKWAVRGQSASGVYIQVMYTLDPDDTVYVIHARPLTDREKRRFRRRRR